MKAVDWVMTVVLWNIGGKVAGHGPTHQYEKACKQVKSFQKTFARDFTVEHYDMIQKSKRHTE